MKLAQLVLARSKVILFSVLVLAGLGEYSDVDRTRDRRRARRSALPRRRRGRGQDRGASSSEVTLTGLRRRCARRARRRCRPHAPRRGRSRDVGTRAGGSRPGALSGDAVEATIDVAERRGIVIPTDAVIEDPESGKTIVFVRERDSDGGARFAARVISIGDSDEARTLVRSGLHAGERIAAQGAFDLLAPGGGG